MTSIKHIRPHNILQTAQSSFCHHQMKIIFETDNCKLEKINHWFKEKRLSLNMEKTNFTLL